ncbi:DUF397 domain-containing protein [Streptomyces sp. NPDC056716]|uniref:DUF397 domain-containing protein n=1 Tax=unclassified Streptomyces TaxID=2593676 RepID=UPI00368D5728
MKADLTAAQWAKSSYSQQGGNCVEWAPGYASAAGVVPVRDSKHAGSPVLILSSGAFAGLVTFARNADVG